MTKRNQFWKGMLLGAVAGGAISLFDKDTREIMKEHVLKVSNKGLYIVKHPKEIAGQIKETAIRIKETVEDVSEDISFITDKVDELRELTPKVTDIVKETKEAFTDDEDSWLEDSVIKAD
ncbi:hypothetical protein BIV60_07545 [Bacillus sp. MUM 116]|uniref:YtxH domain-containing protein n=1 Tax=Bacillus sp. MUM 116 TaxID=1678002 RepID=UPI0008F58D2C|nr:YtxH domain-containing protein [Bacillus sp. MUM 116]OIK15818.1 hypothetical protein BIV60_07545 [Bacillus sp. MUM 116]